MLSDEEKIIVEGDELNKLKVWRNDFQARTIFVNRGKKNKHVLQIIASLALLGEGTTRDIAKYVFTRSSQYTKEHPTPRDSDSRKLEKLVRELIQGRLRLSTAKKKYDKRYPGLESNHFVRLLDTRGNEKNKKVNYYGLDFLGYLFSIGFEFEKDELEQFLKNAARRHLFFAYVQKIKEDTSIDFVKKIFLDPIYEMVKNEKITINENIGFYFVNIIEGIEKSMITLGEELQNIDDEEQPRKEYFAKQIKKWTFYDEQATLDWQCAMMDKFFSDESDREYFEEKAHIGMEINFLYKLMQKIHFAYFGFEGGNIPRRTQKIPVSKSWREYKKYHPEYKNPRDYDKQRKIKIRYDAYHIPR